MMMLSCRCCRRCLTVSDRDDVVVVSRNVPLGEKQETASYERVDYTRETPFLF